MYKQNVYVSNSRSNGPPNWSPTSWMADTTFIPNQVWTPCEKLLTLCLTTLSSLPSSCTNYSKVRDKNCFNNITHLLNNTPNFFNTQRIFLLVAFIYYVPLFFVICYLVRPSARLRLVVCLLKIITKKIIIITVNKFFFNEKGILFYAQKHFFLCFLNKNIILSYILNNTL